MSRPDRVSSTSNPNPPRGFDICAEFRRLGLRNSYARVPPSFLTEQRVPECFQALHSDRLPDPQTFTPSKDSACYLSLSDNEIDNINAAFDAFLIFQPLTDKVEGGPKALQALMLDTWKNGAWKWLLFLYNGGLDLNDTVSRASSNVGGSSSSSSSLKPFNFVKATITLSLFSILKGITLSTVLCKQLIKCPELLGVIGYLWADDPERLEGIPLPPHIVHEELTVAIQNIALDDPNNNPSTSNQQNRQNRKDAARAGTNASGSKSSDSTKARTSTQPPSAQTTIFLNASSHTSPKQVIRVVTKNLERLLGTEERCLDTEALYKQAYLIEALGKASPELCQAMHSDFGKGGLLAVVGKTVGALASAKSMSGMSGGMSMRDMARSMSSRLTVDERSGTPAHNAAEVLIGLVLIEFLLEGEDMSAVVDAVKAGLVKSLWMAWKVFGRYNGCRIAVDHVIYEILGPSLIFRSVLHAVEEDINKSGLVKDFEAMPETERNEVWFDFYEHYEILLIYRDEIDDAMAAARCANPACKTRQLEPPQPLKLKRCSQCEYTKYCSDQYIRQVKDRDFARSAAEWVAKERVDYIVEHTPAVLHHDLDIFVIVDFTTMKKYLKIGGVSKPPAAADVADETDPNDGNQRLKDKVTCHVAISAKVQYGKKEVHTLGAVCLWEEFKAEAYEEQRGTWVKVGENGVPLPKSMARAKTASAALVVGDNGAGSEEAKKKKKKKNKKKKKGATSTTAEANASTVLEAESEEEAEEQGKVGNASLSPEID
ncbi:hypothetical protein D9758_001522 [Tetrapyrgos nigripes]|uniref:Uncharacterized protein n=1 Tax=Tetrapyrgos nigripes TaxID=182062 RepID=A0A8H5GXM4_9AGAR|nr:hypothetical protein D9758_001522 [Tetrapyrgos nigripes]